jgi:hypothetical protein
MSEGFLTNVGTMELFFRFCKRYQIQASPDRLMVLRELTRRKKAKYSRDVKEVVQGKKILVLRRRQGGRHDN